MIRICSDCKKLLGEKEPFEDKRVTHGICDDCEAKLQQELDRMIKERNPKGEQR